MKFWAWGAMVVTCGAIGSMLGACGGSSSTGGGGTGGTGGAASSSASKSSSSASKSSSVGSVSSSSGMVKGSECAMQTTKQLCFNCCGMDFMSSYNQLVLDILNSCACNVPDGGAPDAGGPPCAGDAACQMDCANQTPENTCLTCINMNAIAKKDPCVAAAYAACQKDATCSPMLDCANTYCMQAM